MKQSIYIESSLVSYLTSKPSRNIITLAHQEITKEWWPFAIKKFEPFTSDFVIEECSMGDPDAAKKRLDAIKKIPILQSNEKVKQMANIYIKKLQIPQKAYYDALHISLASIHEIDYLVTWNCTHMANAIIHKKLFNINKIFGVHTPIVCTPEELQED